MGPRENLSANLCSDLLWLGQAHLGCAFISILLYRRIIPVGNFRIQLWVTLAITVGYSIGGICTSMFSCTPIAKSWDLIITVGHCINTGAFYITNGVLNGVTDLPILALLILIVWGLTLSRGRKIGISALFAVGSL